jgi:predicted metal-dependent hydrolase
MRRVARLGRVVRCSGRADGAQVASSRRSERNNQSTERPLASHLRVIPDASLNHIAEVIQAHRRYLIQLMQEWTKLKEDDNGRDLAFSLLTIAGTLEEPTSGAVLVNGQDTLRMSGGAKSRLRRQTIGYVAPERAKPDGVNSSRKSLESQKQLRARPSRHA